MGRAFMSGTDPVPIMSEHDGMDPADDSRLVSGSGETQSSTIEETPSEDMPRRGSRYQDKRVPEQIQDQPGRSGSRYEDKQIVNVMPQTKAFIRYAAVGAAVVCALLYVFFAVHYAKHFYPGTEIYGLDCGGKDAEEVRADIVDNIAGYSLFITGRSGLTDQIGAGDIHLRYEDDGGIEAALKNQKSLLWPLFLLTGKRADVRIGTDYNRSGIDQVLRSLTFFDSANQHEPVNARIGDTEEGYEVVPEDPGSTINLAMAREAVLEALDSGKTLLSLDASNCYLSPKITKDDEELNRKVEQLNALLGADVIYDFGDRQEEVNASVIKTFIEQDEDGSYYVSKDRIAEYVSSLAEKYDTLGTHRIFYTSLGTTVDLWDGDYGWQMNQAETAEILERAIAEKVKTTYEPEYYYRGVCRNANDIGDTYVEICITYQEMWVYQDGYLMVDTPVVTGNPYRNNATPSGGVWAIDAKMRDYTLVGEGYRAPVSYWMPFNGNIGIHDMQSRYYFGGTIYLGNGSHGCVNTPLDAVAQIYDIVSIGTPVVVYE